MKKYLILPFILFITLLIIYKVDHFAYVYVFFILWIYSIIIVGLEKREKWKLCAIYIGSILFALFAAELYFNFELNKNEWDFTTIYGSSETRTDSILGRVPAESTQRLSKRTINDSIIYEVTLTTDEFGRRVVSKNEYVSKEVVFFFGCSFTFGDGVEDHETLPYQFQGKVK